MDKILFSERLSSIRKNRGYKSQLAFAKAYNEKFPSKRRATDSEDVGDVSGILGTLKNYENGNKPGSPNLDIVINMCDLLDCDIDYLLGNIPVPRHETADIMEATGLSEQAVNHLVMANSDSNIISFVSYLLESGHVYPAALYASKCIDNMLEIRHIQEDLLPDLHGMSYDEMQRKYFDGEQIENEKEKGRADVTRSKYIDKIIELEKVYKANLTDCREAMSAIIKGFISHETDKFRGRVNHG